MLAIRIRSTVAALMLIMATVVSLATFPAYAAIYHCPAANGRIVYQDMPCPAPEPQKAAALPAKRVIPAGLHESWFERPLDATDRARCTAKHCECGRVVRTIADTTSALTDAFYIDGHWHRYGQSLDDLEEEEANSPPWFTLRTDAEDAACDIMISQEILLRHTHDTMKKMRLLALAAQDRGYDDVTACTQENPIACEYIQHLETYRRAVADLKALRTPRATATLRDLDSDDDFSEVEFDPTDEDLSERIDR